MPKMAKALAKSIKGIRVFIIGSMKLLSQFKGTKIAIFPLYDAESTSVEVGFMHTGL